MVALEQRDSCECNSNLFRK